jgi:hypothetical protein
MGWLRSDFQSFIFANYRELGMGRPERLSRANFRIGGIIGRHVVSGYQAAMSQIGDCVPLQQ